MTARTMIMLFVVAVTVRISIRIVTIIVINYYNVDVKRVRLPAAPYFVYVVKRLDFEDVPRQSDWDNRPQPDVLSG